MRCGFTVEGFNLVSVWVAGFTGIGVHGVVCACGFRGHNIHDVDCLSRKPAAQFGQHPQVAEEALRFRPDREHTVQARSEFGKMERPMRRAAASFKRFCTFFRLFLWDSLSCMD